MLSSPSDQVESDRHTVRSTRIPAILMILALLVSGCVIGNDTESEPSPPPATSSPQPPVSTTIPASSPPATSLPQPTEVIPVSTPSPPAPSIPTFVPEPAETPTAQPPIIGEVLRLAAQEFDASPDAVVLDSFSERFWSSTALGCPMPGRSYAQVMVPGYKVIVIVDGVPVTYHTGNQHIVRCDDPAN